MSGEELASTPPPKLLRLLYFVGAGFICTVGINKWLELQRKSILQQLQQQQQLPENAANALE
ncbi:PREDICTED: PHAVU_005G081700g [Prunus dulcis]|uniref:PREDICTED: PHAVU_005G081700g n=2 Tax=Prunus dulcis TaxID=3755 RepID=A0A5E4ELP2_PRUDU|nr:PREDICTED: PHAVU_005G081700g [Prunus dulcis]